MERRSFSREFKIEAVRLVRERNVSVAQASRDLDVHENLLRKWVKQLADDPHFALLARLRNFVLCIRCKMQISLIKNQLATPA